MIVKNLISIKKRVCGSAFLLMSALALFSPSALGAQPEKNESTSERQETAAFTAREVFSKLDTPALEILPINTRLDMLDYWDVDSLYKASNLMDGLSWIENMTADYLKVRISKVSVLEVKLLPVKKGTIAMTIYTIGDDVQARDSEVKFYDEDLKELPTDKFLVMPRVKDFFEIPKGSVTKMKEIEDMIPFPTIAFSANPENDNLKAILTVSQYINQDDWNIAKLFAKPDITLEWKKDKYKY